MRNFLRAWRLRRGSALSNAVPTPERPKAPAHLGAYSPLYGYLEHRYAVTVVLSFFDIEALLGFPLPDAARSTAGWWTGPVLAGDRHADAWGAAHRIAKPNLAGRTVAFDRVP